MRSAFCSRRFVPMKLISVFLVLVSFGFTHVQAGGPLRFSFEIADRNICIGDSMEFVTRLTNTGKLPVAIDLNLIGTVFDFERVSPGRKRTFGIYFGKPTHYRPRFLILKPEATYSKSGSFDFTREQFPDAGRYKMQIGSSFYGIDKEFEDVRVWDGTIYSKKKPVSIINCSEE
jgi:hypothetical protein